MDEPGVSTPSGRYVLNDRAGLQAAIDGALGSSGLDDFIGAGTGSLKMVMINKTGSQIRNILQLRVQGVSTVPLDHAWFNRS